MIIDIFIVLLVITIVFIFAGNYFDITALTIVGLGFLFLLGMIIMQTGVEYKTGEVLSETGLTTTITYSYSTFTSTTYGIFVCVIAVVWFIICMMNLRRDG